MKKSNKDERKNQIIDGLYHLILEEGLEGASIANLAKHIGMRQGLIYYYYPKKDLMFLDLLKRIDEYYTSKFKDLYQESKTSEKRMVKVLDYLFSTDFISFGFDYVLMVCEYLSHRDEELLKELSYLHKKFHYHILQLIRDLKDEMPEETKPPSIIADHIIAMAYGLNDMHSRRFALKDIERVAQMNRSLIDSWIFKS